MMVDAENDGAQAQGMDPKATATWRVSSGAAEQRATLVRIDTEKAKSDPSCAGEVDKALSSRSISSESGKTRHLF